VLIQQIIGVVITAIACYLGRDRLMEVGSYVGLHGVLAWGVLTFIVLICMWRILSREWGWIDALAGTIVCTIGLLCYTGDIGGIMAKAFEVGFIFCAGALFGFLINREK